MQVEVAVRMYMKNQKKQSELTQIPGVGVSIAEDFYDLGIRRVSDLFKKDPNVLYEKLCSIRNARIDRCMLYVMRCAVYYASNTTRDPEKLKWWNWKNISSQYES